MMSALLESHDAPFAYPIGSPSTCEVEPSRGALNIGRPLESSAPPQILAESPGRDESIGVIIALLDEC